MHVRRLQCRDALHLRLARIIAGGQRGTERLLAEATVGHQLDHALHVHLIRVVQPEHGANLRLGDVLTHLAEGEDARQRGTAVCVTVCTGEENQLLDKGYHFHLAWAFNLHKLNVRLIARKDEAIANVEVI